MRLAQTLGLYGEVDRMVEMTWPATKRKNWWMQGRALGPGLGDAQSVSRAWERMRADLKEAIVGVRDWNYIQHRYLKHPTIVYDVIGVSSRLGRSLGVVVLKPEGTRWELMDLVGALRDFPHLLRYALNYAAMGGAEQVYCWVADNFSGHFDESGSEKKDIGVSVATNISLFGPSIDQMQRRWWLMSGDTDFK
ncbi:MAG: hypothetical protein D4S02_10900 [Rhodocyclaceae bacterium]|nr:MAG: hypothetical protein D4S02_10900 [Rhodocyclaceae bacterium]